MYFLEVVKMSKVYKWKNGPGFPIYHYFRADVLLLERNNKHLKNLKNNNAFFRLAFASLMLLKKFLNNLPICVEVLLNFIWTHVSIKVNVFIQKNAYYNHKYVHKSMEKYLVQDKYSFSS